MIGVGSRAGDHVDDRGAAKADLRAEIRLLDFELLNRVYGRDVERVIDAAVLLKAGSADAIHQDVSGRIAAAV